ncbi:MAG: hypothetical protein IH614_03210 [Desulfuromonadales bacterium]|nr:hypothetical protein [Desulfuromonadales bacterium]
MNQTAMAGSGTRTCLFLLATWSVSAFLMFFRIGSGEHDTFQMVSGIRYGVLHDQIYNLANYGDSLQFAFYAALHPISAWWELPAQKILLLLNTQGTLLSLLILFLLLQVFRKIFPTEGVAWIPVLVVTTPAYLFTLPYGHPFHYAATVCLAALLLLFTALEEGSLSSRSLWLWSAATLLQGVALSLRAEQVGLLLLCFSGYLLYSSTFSWKRYGAVALHVAASGAIFLLLRFLLLPAAGPAADLGAGSYLGLLSYSRLRLHLLPWSAAHHLIEIGLPILCLAAFFLFRAAWRREGRMLLGFALSVLPSFFIYLFNPSPPRHFIITIISLAVFVSVCWPRPRPWQPIGLGAAILVLNLLVPPGLAMAPGGVNAAGERRNFTYNVFERQTRNRLQAQAALPFFMEVKEKAAATTIVAGSWIHLAQMAMILSDDPSLTIRLDERINGKKVLCYKCSGKTFYLIEAYNMGEVAQLLNSGERKKSAVLTLIDPAQDINDLDIEVPRQLYWWNA